MKSKNNPLKNINPILLSEALRMLGRNIRIKISGFEKIDGTDEKICRYIVDKCYDTEKNYFRTSLHSYPEFYARDFGICIQSLLYLGHKKKVENTLRYALEKYYKFGSITVAINPKGRPFNFPNIYSPDSTAYFFRSLRILGNKKLIIQYKDFLNEQIALFEEITIDKEKGIIKDEQFSGMRDHVIVKSSGYDMIMACVLCDEIDKINKLMGNIRNLALRNPLKKYSLKKNFIKYYWNGKYFKNSPSDNTLTGHTNVFPYSLGVITNKKMLISSITEIQKNKLDTPFPLKYEHNSKSEFIWEEIIAQGWERDTIWTFIGMPYIDIVSSIDKKKAVYYLKQYTDMINIHKAFIEVYTENRPYSSTFYSADTAMLWACNYLTLKKKLKN